MESAELLQLNYLVPCHGPIHCATFGISDLDEEDRAAVDLRKVSVLAGHFSWGEWIKLPYYVETQLNKGDTIATPSCYIVGRHPVNRAISYYYQRCYNSSTCSGYQQRISVCSFSYLPFFLLLHDYFLSRMQYFSFFLSLSSCCNHLAGHFIRNGMSMFLLDFH